MKALWGLVLVAGCTDSSGPKSCEKTGGEACFQVPAAALLAHLADTATGPAILGCGAEVPYPATRIVSMSGKILDYGDKTTPVLAATLTLYSDAAAPTQIATATSDAGGAYTISIPTGTNDILASKLAATGYVDSYSWNFRPNLHVAFTSWTFLDASTDYADMAYGLVRATRDPSEATIIVSAKDCLGAPLEHAVVVMSSQSKSRTFVGGSPIFYSAPGTIPAPVLPEIQSDTPDNGTAAVFNVAAGPTVYVQTWGFPDDAAVDQGASGLVLVSEYPVTAAAGTGGGLNAIANQ